MWIRTLAAKSAIFSHWAMSSASLWSLGDARILRGKRIQHPISDGPLTDAGFSATIDLSTAYPFLEVGAAATGMIFLFRGMVVYCYTWSVLGSDAAMVANLGCDGWYWYVSVGVGTGAGWVT